MSERASQHKLAPRESASAQQAVFGGRSCVWPANTGQRTLPPPLVCLEPSLVYDQKIKVVEVSAADHSSNDDQFFVSWLQADTTRTLPLGEGSTVPDWDVYVCLSERFASVCSFINVNAPVPVCFLVYVVSYNAYTPLVR